MPAKVDTYLALARETAQVLAGSAGAWTAFLDTASRLYKYPFADQLMIHAQRPGATACASYEVWNDTMRRYVRRGVKGIALLDNSGDAPRLRYVFDIADTGTRRSSRPFSPWEINDGNLAEVQLGLRQAFNAEGEWLSSQLQDVARDLAEMYFDAHRHDMAGIVDGSLMAGYDEGELRDSFIKAAYASTAYALLSRCGYDPAAYFDEADFAFISEWNTSEAATALGTAVSENAQMVLRQIERTIRSYERSQNHARDNLHDRERRPTAEPEPAGDGANRPLRETEAEIPPGAPANTVEPAPDEWDAVAAPARDGGSGAAADRLDAAEAGGGSGRDGGAESSRPDEVDGAHEQLQGSGRRSSSERIDLQLNFFDEAEDAQAPSAFSFPQEVMDDVLRLGGNTDELRMRVVAEFETRRSIDEIAAFLPTVYRGGNGFIIDGEKYSVWYSEDGIRVAQGEQARYERGAQLIPWADAAARIGELLGEGRYATKEEGAGAEDYEHELIARKLRDLQHDLSKGNEGLFPNLADVDGGYPEAVQKIAAKLADPEGREAVLGDYLAFREAYKADRSVLRFHYHDVDGIFVSLAVQLLERRKFTSDMERVPEVNSFITQDEIGDALSHGGGTVGSKWRIFKYFTEEHSRSEKAAVLKDLYGTGGHSHALSGASWSDEWHDAKGIRLEKRGCEDVNLTWSAVARRIDELIASDCYMAEAELAEFDLHTAAYAKYRGVKANNSDAIVLVGHGGNYYAYTPDAEQVSRTLDLREQHAGGLDYVVIPSEQLDEALEKLRSRSAVIYVDEAGVEHTLPFIISVSDVEREQYEKMLVEALVNDSAYVNAVRNSDRQNALDEGFAAIRRIAAASEDMRFLKLYHDNAEFRNCLRNDALAAAYKEVSERGNVEVEQSDTSHEPTPVVYIPVDGEWQGFPSIAAAEEAALEEFQKETRRRARNFRIADEHLGEGGAKAKCRANIEAIQLLKYLERNGFQASPEQQEVLSRYVGWGGIPEVFDENKPDWSKEYAELKALLTPEEYEAARGSTLNAHYTSPAVIRAIYEAVGNMGFDGGRMLEPSMGVGNFFGLLPESMANSQLYGVELDSITGRIAKQLYPEASITVAGFETTNRPGFYDLAVGNVPFGQYQVHDPEYDRLGFSIHNYFASKMLDQVRPGGIAAFVTSRYTLDAKDESVRRYLAERGELLGAIRLPNNAFRANAGTDVVSDIIFLQKREAPATELPEWVHVGTTPEGFTVNRYFIDHPEMVLGTPSAESTQYGRQDYTVAPIEGADLSELLHEAVQNIHGEYTERDVEEAENTDILPADPDVRNYSFALVDGEVYYREGGIIVRQDVSAAMTERIKGLMELRDCTRRLIQLQTEDASDGEIAAEQRRLNTLYDAYTAKHGLISSRENKRAFSDDSSYYLLCSLEILEEDGKLERKADMFTRRTIQPHRPVEHTETAAEALAVSLNELGRVDMEYMSRLCGRDTSSANEKSQPRRSTNPSPGAASYTATDSNSSIPAENKDVNSIAAELSDVIFRVPGTDRYVTADEYLSGNVREKLREAEAAAKADQSFNINVEALKAAQPRELTASEIDVRLGATWIEPRYIEQFMVETFQPTYWASRSMDVSYSPYTSEWHIDGKNAVGANDVNAFSTYGTSRISAYKILENTLNLRDVRIYDKVEDADGTERRVLNVKETTLAQQKQQVIKDAFRDWLWKDPKRRETLVAKYNELFNSTRPREYDGSHLTFPGINPEIELREHQRNAIARILYGGNTLLAHEVGAGKTFTMAAAAMEAKRLGLCRKPMFAVPNHLTEQWASEFLRLYPSANILVATKKDFEPANRKKFCARIATGDYDAVIIGHSQFERIPVSQERQERLLRSEIEEITEGINQLKRSSGERFSIKSMEKTKKSLEAKLKKLLDSPKDDVVTFEELGVDRLFVDEAHSYKNLYYHTKMQNVAGLSSAEAQKSSDMYMKCRYMDELTGSRGVVFATGTPVSNSMTELYTMQRYLQHDTLERLGLGHFDSWAANFGETVTALELAPEGTGYRARTRFSKFFNLPELMNLFREVADIKTSDQLMLPTPEVVYHNEVSQPTEIQKKLVQELSERATKVHARMVDPSEDNMLAITNDGRKLGLDQRVVNPLLPDADGTKVNRCVDNVFRIWQDGAREKLTQLIFCDLSTPGKGFNVYDDIKKKLAARGVPESEIAFIHAADTDMKNKELFAKVRSGNVRVLLGSTAKMGAGTNVQDRLIALHDLDAPWRPGDLEQRKGRIARQGNMNETVHVYRYVTEQTFDSYIWVRHEVA